MDIFNDCSANKFLLRSSVCLITACSTVHAKSSVLNCICRLDFYNDLKLHAKRIVRDAVLLLNSE